jgi:hypothetical protein
MDYSGLIPPEVSRIVVHRPDSAAHLEPMQGTSWPLGLRLLCDAR